MKMNMNMREDNGLRKRKNTGISSIPSGLGGPAGGPEGPLGRGGGGKGMIL